MSFIHDTKQVTLPANSTAPVLVCRFNTANILSVMLHVGGGDAKVLGSGRDSSTGYIFQLGQQRIYSAGDFAVVGNKGEPFEIWMCSAGTDNVIVSVESLIWVKD